MQVADGGLAVVYVNAASRNNSSWLCREETVQVRGLITIKPRSSVTRKTRLGCGVRQLLSFNITSTGGKSQASLTLERLEVQGVALLLGKGHFAVVESTLLDVSLFSNDFYAGHVGLDVINSTWTSRYQRNLTTNEVGVSADVE